MDRAPGVWRVGEVVLDLYEVRDVISSGGMGLVHRVLHRGWNVELAVKTPRPELVATERGVHDFEAEAATWVGLGEHPHTVNCVYVRRLDGVPRVFAEWLDGGNLAEAVRDGSLYVGGPREALRHVLDIAVQTAWGLRHAHQHGLIHQDVKPANVLLTRGGTAKVTDFGLAKARAAAGESGSVRPGVSVLAEYGGMTPAYCSPEQAESAAARERFGRPGARLTRATDTWSWALTVLEMFVGYPPCRYGQSGAQVFAAFVDGGGRLEDRTAEQQGRLPAMPEGLVRLLTRCFAWDPGQRPKDMGELAGELAGIYAEALGEPYPRPEPVTAARLADSLSNEALSMLDLGRTDQAASLWRRASQIDPHNPHVAYNRGLCLWRAGELTDAQLVAELRAVCASHPEDWVGEYLLGLVHLERGDAESARERLLTAAGRAPDRREITAALETADRAPRIAPPSVLTGHTGRVEAVALSVDGRTGVSGGEDGTIRVWDLVDGRCVRTVAATDNKYGISELAIDADATLVICTEHEGPARLWDLRTGRLRHVLTVRGDERDHYALDVAVSADGLLALSGHRDGTVRVWDTASGRCVRVLEEGPYGQGYWGTVAVSADGRVAFTLGRGSSRGAEVWDPGTGRVSRTLDGQFLEAALSADGRTAVTQEELYRDARVRVWDLATGQDRCTVTRPGGMGYHCAVSADGRHLLATGANTTELWELTTGRCVRTWLEPHHAVAFGGDGRRALMADSRGRVILRELAPAGPAAAWSYPLPRAATDRLREGEVVGLALARTARLMAEGRFGAAADAIRGARAVPGYRRHRVLLDRWQDIARTGRRTVLSDAWLRDTPGLPGGIADRKGSLLVSGGEDGSVEVWDLNGGGLRHSMRGHLGGVRDYALSEDGRTVMSAGEDGLVRVWDLESGRCRHVLRGHTGGLNRVALSADGRWGLSASKEGTLRVWDLVTGDCRHELTGHTAAVFILQMSADGRYAFSAGDDGAPRIWDVRAGRCLHDLRSNEWGVGAFALSAAGDVLLSGHGNGTVKVRDVRSGRCLHVMPGHDDVVVDVAVTADGTTGVSVSFDGTTRIWDVRTGRCRHVCEKRGLAHAVEISSDGRFAVTGAAAGVVRIWDLDTGAFLHALHGHGNAVGGVRISEDGRIVTTSDNNGVTLVWELDWEYDFSGAAS